MATWRQTLPANRRLHLGGCRGLLHYIMALDSRSAELNAYTERVCTADFALRTAIRVAFSSGDICKTCCWAFLPGVAAAHCRTRRTHLLFVTSRDLRVTYRLLDIYLSTAPHRFCTTVYVAPGHLPPPISWDGCACLAPLHRQKREHLHAAGLAERTR